MSDSFVYDPTRDDFPGRAYEIYRELRDRHPLHRNEARGGWALSRYDDVRSACAEPETFSSENVSISKGLFPMLTHLDPPKHDQLRDLLWKAFTPRRIAALEPRVREIARELIEAFAAEGRCDFLAQFAAQLPSRVIGELIGIPAERREAFLGWTESLITADPGRNWETKRSHCTLSFMFDHGTLIRWVCCSIRFSRTCVTCTVKPPRISSVTGTSSSRWVRAGFVQNR